MRITAGASDVTGQSFTASLNSWGDTVLYGAGLTCVELGPHFGFVQTGSFNTQQVRPWDQPPANTSSRINFSSAFSMPPKVVVWLTSVDMSRDQNWRIVASASDIDNNGFTIHLDTWSDTTLYSAGATWIAYPADRLDVFSGTFSTQDVRSWNQPNQDTSGFAQFPIPTPKVAKLAMGLNSFDYQMGKNLRLRLSTSNVTPLGMTWHFQSWADSVMCSAAAQYFAWY